MTDIASAVGVLDQEVEYTHRQGALDVAAFLLMVTVLLIVGGCLL